MKKAKEWEGEMHAGSPLALPALPWASSRGLLMSCRLWRQRESGYWYSKDRGCSKTYTHTTTPNPMPTTEGSKNMVGPRKMGDPMLTQSPDPKTPGW